MVSSVSVAVAMMVAGITTVAVVIARFYTSALVVARPGKKRFFVNSKTLGVKILRKKHVNFDKF